MPYVIFRQGCELRAFDTSWWIVWVCVLSTLSNGDYHLLIICRDWWASTLDTVEYCHICRHQSACCRLPHTPVVSQTLWCIVPSLAEGHYTIPALKNVQHFHSLAYSLFYVRIFFVCLLRQSVSQYCSITLLLLYLSIYILIWWYFIEVIFVPWRCWYWEIVRCMIVTSSM